MQDCVSGCPIGWKPDGVLLCAISFSRDAQPSIIDLCAACQAVSDVTPDYGVAFKRASNYHYVTAVYLAMQVEFQGKQKLGQIHKRGRWGQHGVGRYWGISIPSTATVACSNDLKLVADEDPAQEAGPREAKAIHSISDGSPVPLAHSPDRLSRQGQHQLAMLLEAFRNARKDLWQRMDAAAAVSL
jgi:hypothetical protein